MKNTVTFNPTEGLIQCGVILKERNSSPICMSKTHLKKKKKKPVLFQAWFGKNSL